MPSTKSERKMEGGKDVFDPLPGSLNQRLQSIHQGFRAGEDGLENAGHHEQEDQRAGEGMQEDGIQTARPYRRRGGAIGGARSHVVRPLAAARDVLQDGKLHARRRQRRSAGRRAFHELEDFFDALTFGSADERNRRTQFAGQLGGVHLAAAAFEIVRHVQDHQRRQFQAEDGAASTRWRPRLVQSRIRSRASGLGMPGMAPARTSRVTCSSSERGFRL